MSATVSDLLEALKPLLRKGGDMLVCLQHPDRPLEALTFVERRPAREATEVDLYSGTPEDPMDAARFYRELLHILHRDNGGNFAVTLFHPAHGSEPLVEISTDGDNLILKTEVSDERHATARKRKAGA